MVKKSTKTIEQKNYPCPICQKRQRERIVFKFGKRAYEGWRRTCKDEDCQKKMFNQLELQFSF